MEPTVWNYVAGVALIGLGYVAVRSLGSQMREAVAELKRDDASLTEVSTLIDNPALVARMEAIELRMAELADTAMRHYNKGSQQMSRARRLMGDPDDDEVESAEGQAMQALVMENPPQQVAEPAASPSPGSLNERLAWKMRRRMKNAP